MSKILRITATGVLLAVFAIACAGAEAQTEIKLPTIQCGMCAEKVQTALKGVDGVTAVKVDLAKKTAQVTYASDKASVDAMAKTVAKIGYDANNVKADPNAHSGLPACCQMK